MGLLQTHIFDKRTSSHFHCLPCRHLDGPNGHINTHTVVAEEEKEKNATMRAAEELAARAAAEEAAAATRTAAEASATMAEKLGRSQAKRAAARLAEHSAKMQLQAEFAEKASQRPDGMAEHCDIKPPVPTFQPLLVTVAGPEASYSSRSVSGGDIEEGGTQRQVVPPGNSYPYAYALLSGQTMGQTPDGKPWFGST